MGESRKVETSTGVATPTELTREKYSDFKTPNSPTSACILKTFSGTMSYRVDIPNRVIAVLTSF